MTDKELAQLNELLDDIRERERDAFIAYKLHPAGEDSCVSHKAVSDMLRYFVGRLYRIINGETERK